MELSLLADAAAADTVFNSPPRRLGMRPSVVTPDRRHATLGDGHLLEVAQVNAERNVLGNVGVEVHGRSHIGPGGLHGLGMRHHGVEVGGSESRGGAEGAPVDVVGEVAVVLAGPQPPQHVASLGVYGLVVAVDVGALDLFHSNTNR